MAISSILESIVTLIIFISKRNVQADIYIMVGIVADRGDPESFFKTKLLAVASLFRGRESAVLMPHDARFLDRKLLVQTIWTNVLLYASSHFLKKYQGCPIS